MWNECVWIDTVRVDVCVRVCDLHSAHRGYLAWWGERLWVSQAPPYNNSNPKPGSGTEHTDNSIVIYYYHKKACLGPCCLYRPSKWSLTPRK